MLTGHAAVPVPGIWFRDAWVHGGDGPGFTWSNTNPWAATSLDMDRRIDYVLVGHPKLGGVGHVVNAELLGDSPGRRRVRLRSLRCRRRPALLTRGTSRERRR